MIDRRYTFSWAWCISTVLVALLSLSGTEAQPSPGACLKALPANLWAPSNHNWMAPGATQGSDCAFGDLDFGALRTRNDGCIEILVGSQAPSGAPGADVIQGRCTKTGDDGKRVPDSRPVERVWMLFNPSDPEQMHAANAYRRYGRGWQHGPAHNMHDECEGLLEQVHGSPPTLQEQMDCEHDKQLWTSAFCDWLLKFGDGQKCAKDGGTFVVPGLGSSGTGLAPKPASLSFRVGGGAGIHRALVEASAEGNRRWAWAPDQFVNATGARESRLKLVVNPRGGAGPAVSEATLRVEPGLAPGTYTSILVLSGGASLKIPVPVTVEVLGAEEPPPLPPLPQLPPPPPPVDDGGPISPPSCALRVTLTEASTGRVLWERSGTAPCVQERPR